VYGCALSPAQTRALRLSPAATTELAARKLRGQYLSRRHDRSSEVFSSPHIAFYVHARFAQARRSATNRAADLSNAASAPKGVRACSASSTSPNCFLRA